MQALNPEKWLERYGDLLFQYTLPRVTDTVLAEDLVQETFLAAFRNRSNYRGEASEKNWLFAILKNKIIDHYRSRRHENENLPVQEESDDWFTPAGDWIAAKMPGEWNSAAVKLDARDLAKVLEACKNRLRNLQQQVYILRYLENLEAVEICKVLGISSSNYWILLHRARLQMRDCMEKNWFKK